MYIYDYDYQVKENTCIISLPFYHPFRPPVAGTEALVVPYPGTDHGTAHPAPESDQRCPHNPVAPGTGFLAGTAPSSTTSTEAAAVVESLLSHCPPLLTRFFSEDNFSLDLTLFRSLFPFSHLRHLCRRLSPWRDPSTLEKH